MGMIKNDFGTMLYDCPKVIGYFSMEEMNQKVLTNYLISFALRGNYILFAINLALVVYAL